MRRLFLEQFHKQIFPSTPITSFEKHFSCHSHLGSIWISLLVPFPPETFLQNDKESGTLELYYLSAYCLLLAKNPTSTIEWISYILLGSLVLTLLCGYSFSLGSWSHIPQWFEQLTKPNHFTYFINRNLLRTSIETEGFYLLSSNGYSSSCVFETQRSANTSSQFSQGDIDLKHKVC
ncbi:hypothetical protein BDA96_08G107500 [Sorghum bicolor]|uniref:Uncharacterized protein n=2 Tax=Sorghum bicolor TaxID=4558 RepID=A0A921U7Q0_SORBI|nr:hypothetical protein BDA96_08G107500 [Sorghum bicolor]KXG23448.1 hypothetical protein SORBI_3008G096300 [Sorghum bicolor]